MNENIQNLQFFAQDIKILLGIKSISIYDGYTPLHIAAMKTPKIINSKLNKGISPGDVATQMGFKEISQYLGMFAITPCIIQ